METLEAGSRFAGHLIEGELGRGGMGVVYAARHIALDQRRALKLLAPAGGLDDAGVERFRREARLAASVDHPAVVRTYDAGEAEERAYISMQLIDGVDLARLLDAGPLGAERAVAILRQVAAGLDAAHEAGLVHRDVKPENVLVAESGAGSERAWLGDFGIGTLREGAPGERLTGEQSIIGTASYMAPEQIAGEPLDGRADVYALACVAFEALTGSVPFETETQLATLSAHSSAPRPAASVRRPGLAPAVDAALAGGMAIDPASRPPTATALIDGIGEALLTGLSAERRPTEPLPESATTVASRDGGGPARARLTGARLPRLPVAAGALVVACLAVGGVVLALAGDEKTVEEAGPALTIEVPRDPVAVAAGARYVWVGSGDAGRVRAYDAATGERSGIGFGAEDPRSLALGPGYLWVLGESSLERIGVDGESRREVPIELSDAVDVAVGDGGVWVLERGQASSRVTRIDPDSLEQTGEAFVGSGAQAIAYGAGAVWVANTGDGTVSRIDADEVRATGSPIPVGGRPEDIAAVGDGVWAADTFGGRLVPIDPAVDPPVVGEPVATLPRPRAVTIGFDSIWVASGEAGVVQRLAEEGSHELISEVTIGADPASATVGSGRVWTADSGSDTVSGIDP